MVVAMDALSRWRNLSERQRRSIVRAARKGVRPDTAELVEAACAWAAWVTDQNKTRAATSLVQKALDWLVIAMEMLTGPTGAAVSPGIYSGQPGYEFLPAVQRAARMVQSVCCQG